MNPKVFRYKNIFPADVSTAGAFIVSVLAFSKPMEERALRRILKCVICDDNAPKVLPQLLASGYLVARKTGQGCFFALSAKTLKYLDFEGIHKPHNTQKIPDKALLTYRLKGEIIAAKIVEIAALLYIEAARDDVVQDDPLPPYNTAVLGLYPRSLVPADKVIHAVGTAIEKGEIPFTSIYNPTLYASSTHRLFLTMQNYDAVRNYHMTISAKRKAPGPNPTPEQAKAFLKLTHDIEETKTALALLTPRCTLCTYRHAEKVLSLSLLDANGIFVEALTDTSIKMGILNNTPYGLPRDTLARRIDYCVTLGDHLGLRPSISIYTLPEDGIAGGRSLTHALDKLALNACPDIRWCSLPDKMPTPKYLSINLSKHNY